MISRLFKYSWANQPNEHIRCTPNASQSPLLPSHSRRLFDLSTILHNGASAWTFAYYVTIFAQGCCTVTIPWIRVSTIFRITWHDHAHTCTCKIESCEKKKIVPGLINYEYRICDGEHNREKNARIYGLSSFGIEFLLSFFSRFPILSCMCVYVRVYIYIYFHTFSRWKIKFNRMK